MHPPVHGAVTDKECRHVFNHHLTPASRANKPWAGCVACGQCLRQGVARSGVFDGGAGTDTADMSDLDIANIVKFGAKGFKFTLDDGSVIQVSNIEEFILTNNAGQETEVTLAGLKIELVNFFGS